MTKRKYAVILIPHWFVIERNLNPDAFKKHSIKYQKTSGLLVAETEKAILLENAWFSIWIPKSIIEIEKIVEKGDKKNGNLSQ